MLTFSFSFAADAPTVNQCPGFQYQLASWQNNQNNVRTPLFNLDIFNGPCFKLLTKTDLQGPSSPYKSGVQFLFDLIIGSCIALAVILFTYGAAEGILNTTNIASRADADKRMKNAIVGLLVVLSVWLVVNTVNPDLLRLPMLQNFYQQSAASAENPHGPGTVRICTGGGC